MKELGVWEPLAVKVQTIKTAVESATLLLRIDDIVSGMSKREKPSAGQAKGPQTEDPDQVCTEPCIVLPCCSSGLHYQTDKMIDCDLFSLLWLPMMGLPGPSHVHVLGVHNFTC